jgi:CSLREA domain-containing protein
VHPRLVPLLLPLLILAACTEQEPSTSPTAPAEPSGPAFSHTAGHKVVTSLADPGNGTCDATQCTLREAINTPGSTEISFAPGLTGLIMLARPGAGGGTLQINKRLSITGPGTRIVIRRRDTDPAFRIVRIGTGANVTLTNLKIRGGKASGVGAGGGGILNLGTLRLTNCVIADNASTTDGGGIFNDGNLTLTNSGVSDNSAGIGGGAIANPADRTLTLRHSTVLRNSAFNGGGIYNNGTATLTDTRVSGNRTRGIGGGINNDGAGSLTLANSTLSGNSTESSGGGVFNHGGLGLNRSTVWGNSARSAGGGIYDDGGVALTNSTVSGNSAQEGGGIWLDIAVVLRNSTVARNSAQEGGGIRNFGNLTLRNSLVALNRAPTGPDLLTDQSFATVTARFSLLRIGSGSGLTNGVNGNRVGSRSAPLDPKLGPLADNGGPTRTHALLSGSPAIDAASTPDCPTTDQRGVLRPQGAACDIGSYERR